MKRRRIYVNLAVFFALFGLMVFWAINQIVSVDAIDKPYTLAAEFSNAFGVLPNSEVTYLGVNAGTISRVERDPATQAVKVTMKIKQDQHIPEGSSANISRKSAIGEQYVDFEPPPGYTGSSGPFYKGGTLVPMERTTVPLEFSELLRSAGALVDSIRPDELATVLHEAAVGLNGRTDSLRQLSESGDRLSATLVQRTDAIDRLATNGTAMTHVLAEHRESLGQSLTDLRAVAETLRGSKGDVSVLLDRGSLLLTQTADIVAHQKGNLDCDLKILEMVVDETTTDVKLKELTALLDIGPTAFADVWDTRDVESDGVWLRVGFTENTQNPAPQFVPPRQLPQTRVVPACASGLRPVAVDYRPASTASTRTGSLPATGGAGALVVAVLLTTAAVVLRSAGMTVARHQPDDRA